MRMLAVIAALLIASPAAAQAPKEYTVKLSAQDLQIVGAALGARPFTEVRDLFTRLEQQIAEQNKPKDANGNPEPGK